MSTIKATVDGTEYSPVESISTGGKTVDLEVELDLENKEVTITENGDTEITPTAGKDGIASVLIHTLVQSGSGLSLLASGEYVNTGSASPNMTIPVEYEGTPKMFLVYVAEETPDVGEAVMCVKWLDIGESATQAYMLEDSGFWVYVNRKNTGSLDRTYGTQASIPMLTNNQIQLYRSNSTCPWSINSTFKWFIWGASNEE